MKNIFPIQEVRNQFPALLQSENKKPFIFFDGPGGTQMALQSVEAMVGYINYGMANLNGTFATSKSTEKIIADARSTVADFLNCQADEVAFGPNMTTLAFSIARSLSTYIQKGDEIVVTELDHRANVDPWVTLAQDKGATVKFIKLNPETYSLELDDLDSIITAQTKLVAIGLSSNVTGTITNVAKIITAAKKVDALVVVDAVHAVPHLTVDFKKLNCDILLCSAYKFFGPHLGIAIIAGELFQKLAFYKLQPAPQSIPYKLETGTQNHEAIAGLSGAFSFIQSLGEGDTPKARLQSGMQHIEAYERELTNHLAGFLNDIPEVKFYRAPANIEKTPTFAFTIQNVNSREVTTWFADKYNMCIADGHFYASTMAEKLNIMPFGGWIRIGLAPYNTIEEVELFKKGLKEFISSNR